jgi:hypothetical protein
MKSKISLVVGTAVLALIVGSQPAFSKGCDCSGQYVDKPVQPPQTPQPSTSNPGASSGDRLAGGGR